MDIEYCTLEEDFRKFITFFNYSYGWKGAHRGKGGIPVYTEDFVRWYYSALSQEERKLFIGAYYDNELVGSLLGLPREFRYHGKEIHGIMLVDATIHPKYRGRYRIMHRIGNLFKQRALSMSYDAIFFFVGKMTLVRYWERFFSSYKYKLQRIGTFNVFTRILDLPLFKRWNRFKEAAEFDAEAFSKFFEHKYEESLKKHIRHFDEEKDLGQCIRLLNNIQKKVDFARSWGTQELAKQLSYPSVFFTLVIEINNKIEGIINYHIENYRDKFLAPFARIDNIYFGSIDAEERECFVSEALEEMKAKSCIVVTLPELGYFDEAPFIRNGFALIPGQLWLYGVFREPNIVIPPQSKVYV
jgi:hypothetical protein